MKHLLTAIACCLAVAGSAQFIPQPMGYNPDSNTDGAVGSEDLLSLLSLYGNLFDNPDSTVIASLSFGPENFYEVFCTAMGGSIPCEDRACDNFPIEPLELPVADVYEIHVPAIELEDVPWYPIDYFLSSDASAFVATLPAIEGFKAVLIYFNVESLNYDYRTVRLFHEDVFSEIDFSVCMAFQQNPAFKWSMREQLDPLYKSFVLLIHTPDGQWRALGADI